MCFIDHLHFLFGKMSIQSAAHFLISLFFDAEQQDNSGLHTPGSGRSLPSTGKCLRKSAAPGWPQQRRGGVPASIHRHSGRRSCSQAAGVSPQKTFRWAQGPLRPDLTLSWHNYYCGNNSLMGSGSWYCSYDSYITEEETEAQKLGNSQDVSRVNRKTSIRC